MFSLVLPGFLPLSLPLLDKMYWTSFLNRKISPQQIGVFNFIFFFSEFFPDFNLKVDLQIVFWVRNAEQTFWKSPFIITETLLVNHLLNRYFLPQNSDTLHYFQE